MLDLKYLRENLDEVERRLNTRGGAVDLGDFRNLDDKRRALLSEAETLKAERNQVSALIGKTKDKSQVQGEIVRMKDVSARIKALDEELRQVEEGLKGLLLILPNLPDEVCPIGQSEEDNPEVRIWGEPTHLGFEPKAHWALGEDLDIIDFERATKIAGARFSLSKGAGARLERALSNFMLDTHTADDKYTEVQTPLMVNRDTMTGTGQLPKFEADLFHMDDPDYFLIPTAEVPVTNIFRDEILDGLQLPICYTAHTPCFRKEAGAHGRDTRGLIRQHQFNKVELVKFVRPEDSEAELETLLADAEGILKALKLPYRVVDLCTGDIGFSAARTFDIEVWLPAHVPSISKSGCQPSRLIVRFRPVRTSAISRPGVPASASAGRQAVSRNSFIP